MPAVDVGPPLKISTTSLPGQDVAKSNKAHSDNSPTMGCMNHFLTASTPITYFTFKAFLKELVTTAISKKTF